MNKETYHEIRQRCIDLLDKVEFNPANIIEFYKLVQTCYIPPQSKQIILKKCFICGKICFDDKEYKRLILPIITHFMDIDNPPKYEKEIEHLKNDIQNLINFLT